MMINSVPANGKLQPELAIAQRVRQKYRLHSRKCDLSPTLWEVRSPTFSEVRSPHPTSQTVSTDSPVSATHPHSFPHHSS
ncbi:hypothetical protein ACOKW7_10485 [Limnospira platensis CENA597]|uniref:hypothetical protein n=1 Tax=Limnospira platensis TaxID=118562 RepID=UPI003DA17A8F